MGFLQSHTVFNITESFDFPFFHPSFLLFFTAPNKDIIWVMKENKGYSNLSLILIFIAPPQLPSLLFLTFLLLYFHPNFLLLIPKDAVAILQQNSGYSSIHNKLAYALSMSLPLLLFTPAAFPPLYLRELIQAKIQPNNYWEFLTQQLMVMILIVFNTAATQAWKQGQGKV